MIVTDYNGNIVPWTETEQEALDRGYNTNCTNCLNCKYCTNCTDCKYCKYCINCTNCTNCTICTDCTICINCTDCITQPIANIITPVYIICLRQDNTLKIDCKDYTCDKWFTFDDDTITSFDKNALSFWKTWKPILQQLCITKSELSSD